MLNPQDRIVLGQSIAPDPGFAIDHALVTTFTLDLPTLLHLLVALTFLESEENSDESPLVRIALLDSIRRHVNNLTVVAETGFIAGPRKSHPLFPLLESAIHTVKLAGGTFHPKGYLVRYLPKNDDGIGQEGGEVRYRLVVSSRNLSPSNAWDAAVVLDGRLAGEVQAQARGLSDFVSGTVDLMREAPTGLAEGRAQKLARMAAEADRIEFDLPEGVRDMRIRPIGFGDLFIPAPLRATEPRLVISPFLGGGFIDRFSGPGSILISRREELDALADDPTESYESVHVLSDVLLDDEDVTNPDDRADEDIQRSRWIRRGLHAKLYLDDDGHTARILIGSANATTQAFSSNRELLLELTVSKYRDGVARMLSEDRLGKYLDDYVRGDPELENEAEMEAERSAELTIDELAGAILELHVRGQYGEADEGLELSLTAASPVELPDGVEISCAPVTLRDDRYVGLDRANSLLAFWERVPTESVTSLVAFRISATVDDARSTASCVIKVSVVPGIPKQRDSILVRRLIASRSQLLQYLAFLLSGVGDEPVGLDSLEAALAAEPGGVESALPPTLEFPLIEKLIQAVDRDPEAVEAVARIASEVEGDKNGAELLPEGFDRVWKPILEAWRRRGGVTG